MSEPDPHSETPHDEEVERSFVAAVDHLLNNVTEAFALIDREGRVLRANVAYRRLTGPAGGASDASLLEYVVPEQRDGFRDALASLGPDASRRVLSLEFKVGRDVRTIESVVDWLGDSRLIAWTARDVTEDRKSEQGRREAESTNAAIERTGGVGHWRIAIGLKPELSAGAMRLLGLDPKSPSPSSDEFLNMVAEEDRERVRAAANEAIQKRKPFVGTFRFRRPDGEVRKLCVSGGFTLGVRGEIAAVHGVIIDRTDEARALREVLNSTSLVGRFVECAPFPMMVCDANLTILMASPEFLAFYDMAPSDTVGRHFYEVFPWVPEAWRNVHQRVLGGETVRNDGERFRHPNGEEGWVRWVCAPWRNTKGSVCGLIVMREDITEAVNSQKSVEESKERMHLGMSLASIMILDLDFEQREIKLEGEWRNLFPERPTYDALTGSVDWIHEADRESLGESWRTHLAGGAPYAAEYRVKMPDGAELWHGASVHIMRAANGSPERALAVVVDITDRKQAERRALDAERKAVAAGAAKSDFLTNMSHEVRTPLNGVLAVSEMLARTSLDSKQQEMVRLITGSGETLLRVMDDLVEFSRFEAGQIEFEVRPFEPEEVIRDTCETARVQAEAKGLQFESFISASIDGVYRGDPVRIAQVLSNLLGNAVKFTESGRISVNATVRDGENGTTLEMVVEDTGVGFAQDVADRLFQGFEQADASLSRKYGGLGLGLSLVKRLVEGMDGRVSAKSEEGVGSRFLIELPVAQDKISALGKFNTVEVEDFEAETTLEGLRLLVAEDNPMNRRVVELLMAQSGVEITFAENGKEAVDKFCDGGFDIVLMDLQMPVMGGLQAMREIRSWEREKGVPATPIIALSANATDDHVAEAKEAGAEAHVAKPIVREVLFETIARHASGRAAQPADAPDDDDFDLDDLDIEMDLDVAV